MSQASRVAGVGPVGGPAWVELLGTVAVHGPDGVATATRPQVQVTLAHLVLERRPVARDEIAEVLWGDAPLSGHWKGAVRGVLSKVRDLFVEAGVHAEVASRRDGSVELLVPEGLATDLDLGRMAVDAAEAALAAGDGAGAVEALGSWPARLQQVFLAAGDGSWVRSGQERVAALARRAVVAEIEGLVSSGRSALAAEQAHAWVARHPLDEGVHELRISALLGDGQRQQAMEAHASLAAVLAEELGVAPAASTTALLGGALASVPPSPRPPSGEGPVAPPMAVPGPIGTTSSADRPFLGRRHELDQLVEQWAATAAARSPRLVLVTGKSGIGKTRLAEELAALVRGEGREVRWARCVPGAALPFEPLASAVQIEPGAAPSAFDDPGLARAEALRGIGAGLRSLASAPALLVIDDLQWASDDVAAALEQTLVALAGPLLVVAAARNIPPAIHDVLARLQRSLPAAEVRLLGLAVDDLLPLFDDGPERGERAEQEASALHRRTGGLPFFVSEVAIAPRRAGRPVDPDELPDAVRDWIGHRADALARPVRARLDLAAVLGDEWSVDVLARAAARPADEVLDELEVLVDEGFLVEGAQVGRFAFAHLITRDAIYRRLGATRRARLHAAAADALAAGRPGPGVHAAIARHLREAGPDHAGDAGARLLLAGREALDSGAWSLAEQLCAEAAAAAPDDPAVRAGALTGMARSLHLQGRREEAERLAEEAITIARANGLPMELAEAVLVLVGRAGRGATQRLSDLDQAALLGEALDGVDALDARSAPTTRPEQVRRVAISCQLEGELAQALTLTERAAERNDHARRALERARTLDPPDPQVTARVLLTSRLARLAFDDVAGRVADSEQVLAIPATQRSVDATLAALTYRYEDLLTLGQRAAGEGSLAEAVALAARSEHPYWRWATATWVAHADLVGGDLLAAERGFLEAASLQAPDVGGAQACLGVNLVNVRLYQGRSGEVLDLLHGAADANPNIPCYRAVHALCAVEAGEEAIATRSYERFRADGFTSIPTDSNRLLTLVVLADAAVQLEDRASVDRLHELLAPAAALQAVLNCYGGGGGYWGPVAHQLARLEALCGRHADAERWFATAEAAAGAVGAEGALARIRRDPMRSPGA